VVRCTLSLTDSPLHHRALKIVTPVRRIACRVLGTSESFVRSQLFIPNTSQQSQNQAAREMMLGLFDADFGRSRLAICEWTIKQRRVSWT